MHLLFYACFVGAFTAVFSCKFLLDWTAPTAEIVFPSNMQIVLTPQKPVLRADEKVEVEWFGNCLWKARDEVWILGEQIAYFKTSTPENDSLSYVNVVVASPKTCTIWAKVRDGAGNTTETLRRTFFPVKLSETYAKLKVPAKVSFSSYLPSQLTAVAVLSSGTESSVFHLPTTVVLANFEAKRLSVFVFSHNSSAQVLDVALHFVGSEEVCDGYDNDLDGLVDEGPCDAFLCPQKFPQSISTFADFDKDGYGRKLVWTCFPKMGTSLMGDCDDKNPFANPGHPEICDGQDNNCNGEVDEGCITSPVVLFEDKDGDGWGGSTTQVFEFSGSFPDGWTWVGSDCDDASPFVCPDCPELCDGYDNNCNGYVDEGVRVKLFQDADGDGKGNSEVFRFFCDFPDGWTSIAGDICDDNPKLTEPIPLWRDMDGDGWGSAGQKSLFCTVVEGWVKNNFDCDDLLPSPYPCPPTLPPKIKASFREMSVLVEVEDLNFFPYFGTSVLIFRERGGQKQLVAVFPSGQTSVFMDDTVSPSESVTYLAVITSPLGWTLAETQIFLPHIFVEEFENPCGITHIAGIGLFPAELWGYEDRILILGNDKVCILQKGEGGKGIRVIDEFQAYATGILSADFFETDVLWIPLSGPFALGEPLWYGETQIVFYPSLCSTGVRGWRVRGILTGNEKCFATSTSTTSLPWTLFGMVVGDFDFDGWNELPFCISDSVVVFELGHEFVGGNLISGPFLEFELPVSAPCHFSALWGASDSSFGYVTWDGVGVWVKSATFDTWTGSSNKSSYKNAICTLSGDSVWCFSMTLGRGEFEFDVRPGTFGRSLVRDILGPFVFPAIRGPFWGADSTRTIDGLAVWSQNISYVVFGTDFLDLRHAITLPESAVFLGHFPYYRLAFACDHDMDSYPNIMVPVFWDYDGKVRSISEFSGDLSYVVIDSEAQRISNYITLVREVSAVKEFLDGRSAELMLRHSSFRVMGITFARQIFRGKALLTIFISVSGGGRAKLFKIVTNCPVPTF